MPMKHMPKIRDFMTAQPHSIGKDIALKTALNMMREYKIRHLPVQEGGKLIGLLTDRDLKLASAFQDAVNLTVEEVMTPDPYTVSPDVSFDEVVTTMSNHKYGCVIVQEMTSKVIGIFTAVDSLRVLGDILRENYNKEKEVVVN
ncbi:MAG: CBS domain-containing protein [Deltaproteobacteria bacterium]|nr:CBS domain-containing protein [Deltaproteobacteria bacterium]